MPKMNKASVKPDSTSSLGMVRGAAAGAAVGAKIGPVEAAVGAVLGGAAGANAKVIAGSGSSALQPVKKSTSTVKNGFASQTKSASPSSPFLEKTNDRFRPGTTKGLSERGWRGCCTLEPSPGAGQRSCSPTNEQKADAAIEGEDIINVEWQKEVV